MPSQNPQSTVKVAGHPLHPMLVPFPIAFLVATLYCDLAFWLTGKTGWTIAAMWLLGAAIVMAALAALAGLTDFLADARIRALNAAWIHLGGNVFAVILSLINFYLRYQHGAATAALPWGLAISVVVVLILLVTGWQGGEMVYRHRVGVADAEASPETPSASGPRPVV